MKSYYVLANDSMNLKGNISLSFQRKHIIIFGIGCSKLKAAHQVNYFPGFWGAKILRVAHPVIFFLFTFLGSSSVCISPGISSCREVLGTFLAEGFLEVATFPLVCLWFCVCVCVCLCAVSCVFLWPSWLKDFLQYSCILSTCCGLQS